MTEHQSAGDSVTDTMIDAAIDRLNGMTPADKTCAIHADSTVLLLRINKQLLKGQLDFAASQSLLRSTVDTHEGRITKVEARAFEAESPTAGNGIVQNFTRQAARQTNPLAWVAIMVVSLVATVWKWKGWA